MEVSVLERQRAVLQRIYQDQFHMDSDDHQLLWQSDDHHHSQPRRRGSCSAASATHNTTLPIHHPHSQCNSTSSFPNKRKPEFDIEEETEEAAAEEKSDITTKTERETSANTSSKESLKASEVEKPDYIHVRARRGQATDSHSLAERARREKISKKMKCLQDLVPGCNKVTGKAGMLDEIINYVQSLQKQVEFLSMKLATVNPRLDFSIDNLFAKEILASLPAQMETTANPACFQYNPMQLGIQVAMDQSQSQSQSHQIVSPKPAGSSSLPIPEVFHDSSCISVCDFSFFFFFFFDSASVCGLNKSKIDSDWCCMCSNYSSSQVGNQIGRICFLLDFNSSTIFKILFLNVKPRHRFTTHQQRKNFN